MQRWVYHTAHVDEPATEYFLHFNLYDFKRRESLPAHTLLTTTAETQMFFLFFFFFLNISYFSIFIPRFLVF